MEEEGEVNRTKACEQLASEQSEWLALNSHRKQILYTDLCLGVGVDRQKIIS